MDTPDTTTTHTTARFGFFPFVVADQVEVRQAGVTAAISGGDYTVQQGGTQFAVVGGSLSVTQGGSQALLVGGDATITQGGAVAMISRSVKIDRGIVGVLLAPNAELTDSTVVFTPRAAGALGGALALGVGVILWLTRRSNRG
jgi:hypothetical protein